MPCSPSPNNHSPPTPMGYESQPYPRALVPIPHDPAAVDFRAFYPYTPNEVKHRKRTTSAQLKVLESVFKKDTKPNANLRTELAIQLDMTPRGVQVWFQNRRAKEKVKGGKMPGSKVAGSSAVDGAMEEFDGALTIKGEADDDDDDDESPSHQDDSEVAFSRSPTAAASSQSPTTSTIASPPQLHLITDASKFAWQDSPIEPPPDSATFPIRPPANPFMSSSRGINNDLFHRRGSLPATAFPQPDGALESPSTHNSFDPLLRRSSVDTSLQRLASNPFASLARAKNSALYGPGYGVAISGNGTTIRHHQLNRTPYGYTPSLRRNVPTIFGPLPPHSNTRRLSMDSRASRFPTLSRPHQSPSPSPLTPYDAVIRASLPGHHLYAVSTRTVASPIPGPLPSPGFSFGAASTPSMASPSSGDSERNSPDSIRSFPFRSEEQDEDATSPIYDAYSSRFGSIASVATSESSINSSYYAEIGGGEHNLAEVRRDSCASGHFLGLLSELEVTTHALTSFSPHEEYDFANAAKDPIVPVHHHQQQQQPHTEASYPSPTSTISPRDTESPHVQDASAPLAVPISTSSELAFALESKPDQVREPLFVLDIETGILMRLSQKVARQEQYITYNGSEHQGVSEQDNTPFYTTQQSHEPHVQQQAQQQQQQSTYSSSTYSSLSDAYPSDAHAHHQHQQQTQQQLDYLSVYSPTEAYEAALSASGAVVSMDNGMQSVDAFTTYT